MTVKLWVLLVKFAIRFEALHQNLHLFHLAKGQVWNYAEQTLKHAGVGAHKWGVDLVQQHDKLVFISCEQKVTLQNKHKKRNPRQL